MVSGITSIGLNLVGWPGKKIPINAPKTSQQSAPTTPSKAFVNASPATQTSLASTPASTTQSTSMAAKALQSANSTSEGSMILGGGANPIGGYEGAGTSPLGDAGEDNQFLKRAGSILLR